MSEAAVGDQPFRLVQRVVEVLGAVHRKYRGKFFVSELLGDVHGLDLADKHLCAVGNGNARERGDLGSALSDDLGVQRAVDYDGLSDLFGFLGIEEIRAARLELGFYRVVHLIQYDHGLLGSADHAVVESL